MKLLFTGFDPFGGADRNPAWDAVSQMTAPPGAELRTLCVPTEFERSIPTVVSVMEEFRPDYTVAVGQAAGRSRITPERIAINVDDARIPDNAGMTPLNTPVISGGNSAYFSTLPIYDIRELLLNNGIPCEISNSAGTFVCNHLMYGILHEAEHRFPNMKCGFIHVPCIPEQLQKMPEGTPALPLSEIIRGLDLIAGLLAGY